MPAPVGEVAGLARAVTVGKLAPGEVHEAARIMATAFQDDPFMMLILPDATQRARALPHAMRATLIEALPGGGVIAARDGADTLLGVGVTYPFEGGGGPTLLQRLRASREYITAGALGWRNLRTVIAETALAERMKPPGPFAYIELLAVDRGQQGKGVGSAMIKHVLGALDAGGHPGYIETSNPRNVPLYERMGFHTIKSYTSRGVTNFLMWREPGAVGEAGAAALARPA